jgi:hypothetical protein
MALIFSFALRLVSGEGTVHHGGVDGCAAAQTGRARSGRVHVEGGRVVVAVTVGGCTRCVCPRGIRRSPEQGGQLVLHNFELMLRSLAERNPHHILTVMATM